jgi:hypothetical protein
MSPVLTASMNAAHEVRGNCSTGPPRSFESRQKLAAEVSATSTHSLSWLRLDLRQFRSDTVLPFERVYVAVMAGESIQLHLIYGLRRVEKWRHSAVGGWQSYSIEIGRLPDRHPKGRWYTTTTQRATNPDAWAWPDEDSAQAHLAELKATHDDWIEIPAAYDADMQPATPGPWVRSGSTWRRP